MDQAAKHRKPSVDGRRKRRHAAEPAKRKWYAKHRMLRFAKHFGFDPQSDKKSA